VRKPFSTGFFVALLCLLATSPGAVASTEFGDHCVGNDTETGWTVIGQGNGETYPGISFDAGPSELRFGPGEVITRWKVQVGPGIAPIPQQLLSLQLAGEREARLLGESAIEMLHEGTNEFETRIPGAEYGLIGLRGPEGTLFCDKVDGHFMGAVVGDFPVGATREPETEMGSGVPVIATVEPDADGDGYGDETQDGCRQSPLWHTACPVVSLRLARQQTLHAAVLFSVTISATATLRASAEIAIPRRTGKRPPRMVPVDAGAQLVPAETPTTFRVPLPKAALKRLPQMPAKQKVKVKITAMASDAPELEGRVQNQTLTVLIPGRLRGHPRR
jgi:hypothetical protein